MPLAAAAVIGVVVIGIVPVAPTLVDAPPPPSEVVAAPPAAPSPTPKTIAAPPAAPQLGAAREFADHGATVTRPAEATTAAAERSMAPSTAATADEWIARIRPLRNDGRIMEAAHALTDFRAAFIDADSRLPGDLRAWAKTVR